MPWRTLSDALRRPLTPKSAPPDAASVRALAARLEAAAQRRLGRSLALRAIDAGSCNGCELELRMLAGLAVDLQRYGLYFVDSPRHADVLLVTGPVTRNMHAALVSTWQATPDPKWVVAIGDCAIDGGVFRGSPAITGGIDSAVPVDLTIRGCPATPAQVLDGLRTLLVVHSAPNG